MTTRTRRRVPAALALVLVVALGVVSTAALLWAWRGSFVVRERCEVRTGERSHRLSPEQAANAATIAAVGLRSGVGERGVVIALATAMQESKLRNLDHGDRDSLGLFQQRPSQGWGTAAQVRDPVYASRRFYAALKEIDGWARLPLREAAQRVQRSGFPEAYAAHEDTAALLAGALTGRVEAALSCEIQPREAAAQPVTGTGLTMSAEAVRDGLERAFGDLRLGGFDPRGVRSGHIEGSRHYEGRAIDVFFRPVNAANQRRGWAVAHWLVANADQLGVATVIYDDRIWTARRSGQGWRPYVHPSGNRTDPVLRHVDHVHLDV